MAKTILTPKQSQFLELAANDSKIVEKFFLTGGTALSEFYLHHRLSEDIDLFCQSQEVDQILVEAFLEKNSQELKIEKIKRSSFLGLSSYTLIFQDKFELKVDFNYYPFLPISKGKLFRKLRIDSLYDIAANKVHTLFMKPRSRDYIDLFFIFKTENYSLEKLILDAKAKFDWHIDPVTLSAQFIRVKEITDLPTMLVPFNRNGMEKFFLDLAKSLDNQIFIKK